MVNSSVDDSPMVGVHGLGRVQELTAMLDFPTPLLKLLDWKNAPQASRPNNTVGATLSDWLELNQMSVEQCRAILQSIEAGEVADVTTYTSSFITTTAERAWMQIADAFLEALPTLSSEITSVSTDTPKCLANKPEKFPQAFTYDLGQGTLPFVSVPYQGRAFDHLAMAHEFGHALQIVCSDGEQMPPIARECCAFLGEQFMIQYLDDVGDENASDVHAAWEQDNKLYLKSDVDILQAALDAEKAPYNYRWNYPIARYLASKAISEQINNNLVALYTAGSNAPKILEEWAR